MLGKGTSAMSEQTVSPVWPPERIAHLSLLVQTGDFSTREIGQALHTTKNAIIGKAHRLGLTGPRMKGPKPKPPESKPVEWPAPGRCVFPIGHPRQPGFCFCCEPVEEGHHYCQDHHQLTYRPSGSADD
jgi:GcrA cell cycle regulator